MSKLRVENLNFSYNSVEILKEIDFSLEKGEFMGIIGPNGSGKSTLLKNIYKTLSPNSGKIFIDEEEVLKLKSHKISSIMSVVTQQSNLEFDFKIIDIVLMGRYNPSGFFKGNSKEDKEKALKALEIVGLKRYKDRLFSTLSGGERQRVIIARAIAQENSLIILDEPTNHLDIKYQMEIMEILKSLKITVLAVFHDINLASNYCDRIIVLEEGKIRTIGKPKEIYKEELFQEVFKVKSYIFENPITKKVQVSFLHH